MNLLKLKVVLWKNLKIRKRHGISTVIESLLPVVTFLFIAYARSNIKGLNKLTFDNATYHEAVPISYTQYTEDVQLLFTPDNSNYQNIMQRTIEKFQLPSDRLKGFSSEESLKDYYYKNSENTIIAIIFNGNNEKHLDYTIRYHDHYGGHSEFLNTDHLFSNFQYQQQRDIDYLWKGFISTQKAVDISFIEVNLGRDIEDQFNLYLKEFPYPSHKVDAEFTTTFIEYIPCLTLFSFIFVCPAILKRVVEEKQTGTKELLKMNGMKTWMLWLGWLIYGMMPMFLSVTLIVIIMKQPLFGTEYPLIKYSDGTVLFCYLLLYCMAANFFCFAISSWFSNPLIAMISGILIWILSYLVPKFLLELDQTSFNIVLNLFPNMALHYGYSIMASYEEREIGLQWSNIGKPSSGSSEDITLLNVFIMLLADMVIYMLFTLYMDRVNPGEYGVKDSPLFIWKNLRKLFTQKMSSNGIEDEVQPLGSKNVEDGLITKKGIIIENLCKKYGKINVVNNLNMDIYKDNITVLLGHNGAGKSTAMSMITGMLEPTSGVILVNNSNVNTNQDEIRSMIGLCPQHNYLFPDLTVKEHLVFFAMLKGKSKVEAYCEANKLLSELQMFDRRNEMAHTLSGGMKRRLCVAMAAIGDSSILVLDEPSAGMDIKSRREFWNLLRKWRRTRTILITTHLMEEAEILGDWIAIMSNGRLDCSGTPMGLKRQFHTGYHLSLIVRDDTKDEDINVIKTFVENHMLGSYFTSQNGDNVKFVLPHPNSQIDSFLSKLEQEKGTLKIKNFFLAHTTLEDVFLKCNCVDEKMNKPEECTNDEISSVVPEETSKSMKLQIKTLFKKRILFFWKLKCNYVFLFFIASLFFWLTIYFSSTSGIYDVHNGQELKLNLDIYRKSSVFVNSTSDTETTIYKNIFKQLINNTLSSVSDVENVDNEILKTAKDNIIYYKEHIIINSEFTSSPNGIDMCALYNGFALHSSPISLNLLTNTIAKAVLGNTFSISVSNWPLERPKTNYLSVGFSETKIALLWLIMIPLGCLFILGSFIIFPQTEINSNFLQIQYMCGVKHYLYWVINLVTDFAVYLLLMAVLAITVCCTSAPFQGIQEFVVLYCILCLYGISGIPCTYLFCRKKSASGGFSLLVITGMFLGIFMTLVIGLLSESGDEYYVHLSRWLQILCFLFIPQVGLSYLLVMFSKQAVKKYNMQTLPKHLLLMSSNNPKSSRCSSPTSVDCQSYMDHLDLWYFMLASAVIFFAINILLDSYFIRKCFSRLLFKIKLRIFKGEQLMKAVKDRQNNKSSDRNLPSESSEGVSLEVDKMLKCYSGKPVVKNVSITLNKQECLGILGVNGAGKSTTLRMLTRDAHMDMGEIDLIVNEEKVDIENDKYVESFGYCPQNDALNHHLTGREILEVIANLRGVKDPAVVDVFLKHFQLTNYADIPCSHYSGGNKRKLSLAISLIGFPQFVLLDEPTNGVDPLARKKLWSFIKNVQKRSSFILTSHSMAECEALCSRVQIMKDGEIMPEGLIHQLKKEQGVNFKVKLSDSCHRSLVEKGIHETFNNTHSTLNSKDEDRRLLHFCIKGTNFSWGRLFRMLENFKTEGKLEDYSVSGNSLEDVFLSVATNNNDSDVVV